MGSETILIKDTEGLHFLEPIQFVEAVPDSLRCALCKNVSPKMTEDSGGHMYCVSCLNMIVEDGQFECEHDGKVEQLSEMRQSQITWDRVLRLVVKCPNQKSGCRFQASVEDFLIHHLMCQGDTRKPCAFCSEPIESKLHASHLQESCPKRLLNCPYCSEGIEACCLDDHLEECDYRPEDCRHCGKPFDTFKELRDVHLPQCAQRPIDCPYKPLGCDSQGPRHKILTHAQDTMHIEIVLKMFNEMRMDIQELRKENAKLKERIQTLEDHQLESDQYRLNIEDSVDLHRTTLQNLEAAVQRLSEEPVGWRRVDELQERFETYLGPLEHLLNGLHDVNRASITDPPVQTYVDPVD